MTPPRLLGARVCSQSAAIPQAGVLDADRTLLKDATVDHAAFRAHSGDGDIGWQARLQKSGILIFELLEAGTEVGSIYFSFLIFLLSFDFLI